MQFTMRKKNFFVCRRMKNHLPQNGFTGWIKTGTNVRERVERREEKSIFPLFGDRKMSSSVCRFAMITLRMLTGFHGDVDGWACQMSE